MANSSTLVFVLFVYTDAIRMSTGTTSVTNRMIEDKIKSWLRQARDRNGGRKRRYLAAAAKENAKRCSLDLATDYEASTPSSSDIE